MLPLFFCMLALATLAQAATRTVTDCKSNAECLSRGLPLKPPRRLHQTPTIQGRQNPLPTTFTSTGQPQYYFITQTGTFQIDVAGGSGGSSTSGGGIGARFAASVQLTAGQNYTIISGGMGGTAGVFGGGGGGSFVYEKTTLKYLVVAGGGGGSAPNLRGDDGATTLTGTATTGASGGAGGASPPQFSLQTGAGGAGINGAGADNEAGTARGGSSRTSVPTPWAGGVRSGAYGGGGGSSDSGGGGGGYSGGDGGDTTSNIRAGGGGSFVDVNNLATGTTPILLPAPSGTGQVTFTFTA